MKKNIGTKDRIVRLVIGIVCIVLAIFLLVPMPVKIILGIAGVFSIYQALTSWCLFYQLIGKNTCPIQ